VSVFERSSFVVVGHRGGRGGTPPLENTFGAFERAVKEGADAIELDVRLCATGEVVVFHDPDLKRMSAEQDRREVQRVSYLELATQHRAPVLRDVVVFCNDRRVGLNVEVKYDAVARAVLASRVLCTLAEFPDLDAIVSSFDPRILARIGVSRRHRLALLTTTERRWSLPLARALAARKLVHAIHLEQKLATPREIRAIRARGVDVGVWTVNDPEAARALRAAGADWVITDAPGKMRAVADADTLASR
jgi:glycerophosphoryl diester phosphodiesterase